jgi:obg-like ATPase 1
VTLPSLQPSARRPSPPLPPTPSQDVRNGEWSNTEIEVLNDLLLLTAKQVIYLVNLSQRDFERKKNKWLAKIKTWVEENEKKPTIIPYSAEFEYKLATMEDDEARKKHCEEVKITR